MLTTNRFRLEGEPLTGFEEETLHLLSQGLTSEQMAPLLFITQHSVKTRLVRIYSKLRANNAAHAVSIGYQLGYLKAPERRDV